MSVALTLYRGLIAVLGPFAGSWLNKRAKAGKEDTARLGERFGRNTDTRPPGRLVWLHAASVGESGVALQLVNALGDRDPTLAFLITTGTRTSAALIAKRVGARLKHAYVPLDRPDAVKRFLAHWRPDLGVFVESELWPNLILEAQRAQIPLALVNARMSPKTLGRWTQWPDAARRVFDAFALILAADQRTADALTALTETPVVAVGNLKLAAAPRVDEAALATLEAAIGQRDVWLAASTHEGEESILLAAHAELRTQFENPLLIIAPRHPDRGAEVAALANDAPRRALDEPINGASVYIADTMGELGLFYAAVDVAFIGGSLRAPLKGHNAVEPAKLGAAIITGPNVESFQDLFDELFAANGAARAGDAQSIAREVAALWRDPKLWQVRVEAARAIAQSGAAALEQTVARLEALTPADEARANAPA